MEKKVYIFTFHYVSIKSRTMCRSPSGLNVFTFHYVSIKSDFTLDDYNYLKIFTFHYVSIKSGKNATSIIM